MVYMTHRSGRRAAKNLVKGPRRVRTSSDFKSVEINASSVSQRVFNIKATFVF